MKLDEEIIISQDELSYFADLVGIQDQMVQGFWLLYLIIVILSVVVYKLGFSKKLPVLKSVVIYIALLVGCFPLTFFGIAYPVAEGLFITAIILIVYKIRLHQSRSEDQAKG
jgi:hypothetical protein